MGKFGTDKAGYAGYQDTHRSRLPVPISVDMTLLSGGQRQVFRQTRVNNPAVKYTACQMAIGPPAHLRYR
ncbi:hypothetical protein GCM10011352_24470 [Marinobacterium zhoushanense]|uniref:Uncharacterized protein n=1 Tax=Marinobacterium zhoushanense TaxID=1679163 RepID=A0ABQ1KIH3_9GAMM|nr:hypothetical protein GCM10011352_24470 [Marinobacterium zhoushanense]